MKGNIYICLNEETYNSEIPDIFSRYRRPEYDEEGVLVQLLPTTYAQMAEDNKYLYGTVINVEVNESQYYIVEMTASWLEGEVSYLLDLGEGLSYPSNAILTSNEVSQLIADNTQDLV
jgi:hypothetical protein